jgi:hypothetical protein
MYSRLAFAVTTAATLFGAVSAAGTGNLTIISPGGSNLWWVANSQNNIVWTCQESPYGTFTVLVANSDPKILAAPIAIIAIENNYDCSKEITQDQANQAAGTGYTIQLANPLNNTDVYAESQPFEIKPLGSTYPPASATPSASGTQTASETGASASASSTSASSSKNGSTTSAKISAAGLGLAMVAAAIAFTA